MEWIIFTELITIALPTKMEMDIALTVIPVNNNFEPDPEGIEVQFTSSLIHADIARTDHNRSGNKALDPV